VDDDELCVNKWSRAERDAVYAAWTEPEIMRRWFFRAISNWSRQKPTFVWEVSFAPW